MIPWMVLVSPMNEPLVCEDCQTTARVKQVFLALSNGGYKALCPKCWDIREAPFVRGRVRRSD